MTKKEEIFVIQKLVEIFEDCNLKNIGKIIGASEYTMRALYHERANKSLTRASEQKLHDFIEVKVKKLYKLIKFIEKHQLVIEAKTK